MRADSSPPSPRAHSAPAPQYLTTCRRGNRGLMAVSSSGWQVQSGSGLRVLDLGVLAPASTLSTEDAHAEVHSRWRQK